MSIEFLKQVATMPLPKSYSNTEDIDAVKILRQAGLVIALLDEPPEGVAKVLAITEKGTAELLRFHYPDKPSRRAESRDSWLHLTAQRVRQALQRTGATR